MIRMSLSVDEEVPDLLSELAGGERKRGEYLNNVIRQLYAGQIQALRGSDLEGMKLQLAGTAGKLMQLDGRLHQVEGQLAAIMAKQ